ncbi:MAG: hypothetical protein KatS3mg053_0093 [Candidatus Roseilinea sp.]|nr:MAG: hypothetical protein KatS3mg053_0093 [Candidatus Roseilinea sp.]
MKQLRLIFAGLLVSLLFEWQAPQIVRAAGYVVNSTADNTTDDAFCTLREAILAANNTPLNTNCGPASAGDDTITFSLKCRRYLQQYSGRADGDEQHFREQQRRQRRWYYQHWGGGRDEQHFLRQYSERRRQRRR